MMFNMNLNILLQFNFPAPIQVMYTFQKPYHSSNIFYLELLEHVLLRHSMGGKAGIIFIR